MHNFHKYCLGLIFFAMVNCKKRPLFVEQNLLEIGIEFQNQLIEDKDNNIMTYEYFYNGGGVAVGDLNNDGLADIYFSGNSVKNRLFLNKGNWKFEDITKESAITEKLGWKTGVTMADVNGDGLLDVYVSYSGNAPEEGFGTAVVQDYVGRANQLFINTGVNKNNIPVFSERSKEYGLDAIGTFSTQAYFFDYDLDGDLDMFLLNHANKFYNTLYNVKRLRSLHHPYYGNRLYENKNNKFIEVSEKAGIFGSGITFGLSAAISDLNKDGYPDIYVTNDYEEQDFCYLNNGDGTFDEVSKIAFGHLSTYGMGSDIADVNNDALPDVFVADMLPEDNYRQKILKGPDAYNKFNMLIKNGYHYQYMRNTLQMNRGLSPDSLLKFSEVGQLSGVSNTDWSWAPLIADYDNDGLKDIFVTNGFLRDFSNLDFTNFTVNEAVKDAQNQNKQVDLGALVGKMSSTKIPNYAFQNIDGLSFKQTSDEWGLSKKTVSNAAAYADLDNDGDLDLIVNNLNEPVLIYKNESQEISDNKYFKIKLKGEHRNSYGLGAKVTLNFKDGKQIYQEAYFGRGYQSSVEPVLNFGLGKYEVIDKVVVLWADGKKTVLRDVKSNQSLQLFQKEAIEKHWETPINEKGLLADVTAASNLEFIHQENLYVDFDNEKLIPYQLSMLGGKASIGDVNGDGNDDVYFEGAKDQISELYLGNDEGNFKKHNEGQPWTSSFDSEKEDVASLFFDADGDGDLDLYVVSGGNEEFNGTEYYQDRIYLNDGQGNFLASVTSLPNMKFSGGVVKAADYDNDGDLDLFIGGRVNGRNYPLIPRSTILRNDSSKKKVVFTNFRIKDLDQIGMVTDAIWEDIDNDSWLDLILVGEWMPITILKNNKGQFLNKTKDYGLEETTGWWFSIASGDFDQDGDTDFLIGNLGLNTQLKASREEPMRYHVQDIDNNGRIDPMLSYYIQGKSYPMASRDELLGQVAPLKQVYTSYSSYAKATTDDVLKSGGILPKFILDIKNLKSSFLEKKKDGSFELKALPLALQASVIQSFVYDDFDDDGEKEVLVAGNLYPFRVSLGKMDASFGSLLKFEKGNFKSSEKNKLWLSGDIRDLNVMHFNSGKKRVLVTRNNDRATIHAINE